jgi:hypothetical protein
MAPMSSTGVKYVRVDTELRNRTANAKIRIAARSSDDGVTWSDAQVAIVTTWTQANGITYGTSWIEVAPLFTTLRAYIQLGVECGGTTANQNELGLASIRVDVKAQ